MAKRKAVREGYNIFISVGKDDNGFEITAANLCDDINAALEDFDVDHFLGGPQFRDDPSSRGVCIVAQAVVLKRKT
jgi:hypothetical protein